MAETSFFGNEKAGIVTMTTTNNKQTPMAPEYAEISTSSLQGGNGDGEGTVAGRVHKIFVLALACFGRWLKPLFSNAERQNLSPIQEHDPYVEGLLRYIQSQRRD